MNLVDCSETMIEGRFDRTQVQCRLFWSLQLLEYLIGPVRRRQHSVDSAVTAKLFARDQLQPFITPLPRGPDGDPANDANPGIWSFLVQLAAVWKTAREYVTECAEGRNCSPWMASSTYAHVNEMVLDSESSLPESHRWRHLRFPERSAEEIQTNPEYWTVWLQLQLRYHCVHAAINHPFLYAQSGSAHKKGPNVFWRTSADLAFLHATWISNLIDMSRSKGLIPKDPFSANACAIAGSLHLFRSQSSDSRVRAQAEHALETCQRFLRDASSSSPYTRDQVSAYPP